MTTMVAARLQKERHTISRAYRRGIKHGYRSGLEVSLSRQIEEAGLVVSYEEDKIRYVVPAREATYTPDFKLPKSGGFFFIEGKGLWDVASRHKHILIQEQHPDIDIRFVFSNQNARLYKGSPTTYAQFCEKHGFQYANRVIPDEWLKEHEGDEDESE
jgi:hypothetical protein